MATDMTTNKFPIKKAAVSIGAAILAATIGGFVYKTMNPGVDVRLIAVGCILAVAVFVYGLTILFKSR